MFTRYPISRPAMVIACDVTAFTAAMPLAIMLRESTLLTGDRLLYLLSCFPLLAAAGLAASLSLGHYRAVWRYMGIGEIKQLAQCALLALLVFWLGQFFVDRLVHLPRSGPVLHYLVAIFILIGSRIAYGAYCRWQEGSSTTRYHRKPLLLVGSGSNTSLFIQMLASHHDSDYKPAGIICDGVARNRSINGVPVLGRLDEIDHVLANLYVQGMSPARLVVAGVHHELRREAVNHVLQRAAAAGIPVEQLPNLMTLGSDSDVIGLPPGASETVASTLNLAVKRFFDTIASATILAVFSPLLALAAIAVALGIRRPVLFVQTRRGLHGRPFRLLKFRTMHDPLNAAGRLLTDAERTPVVGRLLRCTRLDELPQFWNVLKGDMAIIGPRPLIAHDLDAMPDHGVARSRNRPGITGWAQVNGGHKLRPDDKLALDLWYIENASFGLDIRIVWRTIRMILIGEKLDDRAIQDARDFRSSTVEAAE